MRRRLPPGLAITLLIFATGCGRNSKSPDLLQATPEAISLIRDNEARCAKIGQDGFRRLTAAEEEVTTDATRTRMAKVAGAAGRAELDLRTGRLSVPAAVRPGTEPSVTPEAAQAPPQPSEVFKKYLAEEAAGELAAADSAQSAIQDLLPRIKAEAPNDLTIAVESLAAAHDQVCAASRQPQASAQYQGALSAAENGYRAAEEKLRPLYTVSDTDSQFALHKYGPRLEEARAAARERSRPAAVVPAKDYESDQREWQAAQQLQAQQQVEHEVAVKKFYGKRDEPQPESVPRLGMKAQAPQSPEDRGQAMKAWYPRYTAKVGGVKAALSTYLRLRNAGVTDSSLPQSCDALMAADGPLLDDPVALEPPDPQAAELLRAAFTELQGLAQACHDGMTAETIIRFDAFERTLGKAAAALRPYSLNP
jgi:hypothetical protein